MPDNNKLFGGKFVDVDFFVFSNLLKGDLIAQPFLGTY